MDKKPVIFVIFQKDRLADGGVTSASEIVNSLSSVSPIIITQRESERTTTWRSKGIPVVVWTLPYVVGESYRRASLAKKLTWLASYVGTNVRLFWCIRRTKASAIYANDLPAFFHSVIAAKCARAELVVAVRDTKPAGTYNWKWKLAGRLCDRCVALSNEMRVDLETRGVVPSSKIETLYSVIPRRSVVQSMPNASEFAIGIVGAVEEKKGQLEFLKHCVTSLVAKHPTLSFYFVGDCDLRTNAYAAACLKFVQDESLSSHVHFVGFSRAMGEWYARFKLLVIASTHEGLPRAMGEALSYGVPVLSFATCSASEILLNHNCGYVVAGGDYDELATQIKKLSIDPELCEELGRNGIAAAELLFGDHAKQKFDNFIAQAAGGL